MTLSLAEKQKRLIFRSALNLDGSGKSNIETGIGFFDHMLEGFSKHGFFDLRYGHVTEILNVDCHHTIEDCGIVLGRCDQNRHVGDKKRHQDDLEAVFLPMDEALVLCAVDLSGTSVSCSLTASLPARASGRYWIQRWCENFSMRSPTVRA